MQWKSICWRHVCKVHLGINDQLHLLIGSSEEVQNLPWGLCDGQPPTSFSASAYSPGCCQPHAPHRVISQCAGSYSHTGGWAANAETGVAYWEKRSSVTNTLNYRLGTHLASGTDAQGQMSRQPRPEFGKETVFFVKWWNTHKIFPYFYVLLLI